MIQKRKPKTTNPPRAILGRNNRALPHSPPGFGGSGGSEQLVSKVLADETLGGGSDGVDPVDSGDF